MPVQTRFTSLLNSSGVDSGVVNPRKQVTINGHLYTVTPENMGELSHLREQEYTDKYGSIDSTQKVAIAEALRVAAFQPLTGSAPEFNPNDSRYNPQLETFPLTTTGRAQKSIFDMFAGIFRAEKAVGLGTGDAINEAGETLKGKADVLLVVTVGILVLMFYHHGK